MVERGQETGAEAIFQQVAGAAKRHPKREMTLEQFLQDAQKKKVLSRKERLRIVEQALLLLESNYVHLPLKRAMHAVDPIQRLKLLRFRLQEMPEKSLPTEMQFHQTLLEIFASTRDLHTMYLLPAPYKDRVAYLPFLIEQYFEPPHNVEKFMVSRMVNEAFQSIRNPGPEVVNFKPGVEVLTWNGIPIRRAIELNGESQAGSNLQARFARGLDNLTIRPLDTSLPPDESWVTITYRALPEKTKTGWKRPGQIFTLPSQKWLVYTSGVAALATETTKRKRAAVDIKKTKVNHVKRRLYQPKKRPVAPRRVPVRSGYEEIFYAEARTIHGREIGYVRLFSLDPTDPDRFVTEFKRVITSKGFPQEGLIIDVRGNAGGKIRAAERLLQLFTPRRIQPELFEFINTPLNLEICRLAPKFWMLSQWAESIAEAVITGATYSSGFPMNSADDCNDIGQVYYGPVILITDALSYSATDIFAAGFQDNEIGVVLGTSDNTGAGGANVWRYHDLMNAARKARHSPFKRLPKGANLVVAVRRSVRVGRHAGRPLEELGIAPDRRHYMTKHDVLNDNRDLIAHAAHILTSKPGYSLSVKPWRRKAGPGGLVISADARVPKGEAALNVAYVEIYVNDRHFKTLDAGSEAIHARTVTVESRKGTQILVQAFDRKRNLVASYRHRSS